MAALLGGGAAKPAAVTQPSPAPQVDDAAARLNSQSALDRRQGRRASILTSDTGLPDLGRTSSVGQ